MAGSEAPVVDRFPAAPDAPSVPGLLIRHLRRPADYPRLNEIANAMRQKIGQSFTTTDEQMAAFYEGANRFVVDRDVAVFELDGATVGYARTGVNQQPSGLRVYELVCFIDPAVDPTELYPAMLSTLEFHIRGLAADDLPGEKAIETFGGDDAPDLERLVLAAGFAPIRHGYSMVRPHVDDLPESDLPAGLEIRPVRPEHRRAIWDAATEAFRDAWGFAEPTEGDFEQYLTDPLESQTDLWRVAWDGDEVAGQVRSYINDVENERFGRLRGYTEAISVRRPWRRRGLARALIGASIVALRDRGMTETALGVDTENVTGALQLYQSCGYVPVSRSTVFHKRIA